MMCWTAEDDREVDEAYLEWIEAAEPKLAEEQFTNNLLDAVKQLAEENTELRRSLRRWRGWAAYFAATGLIAAAACIGHLR